MSSEGFIWFSLSLSHIFIFYCCWPTWALSVFGDFKKNNSIFFSTGVAGWFGFPPFLLLHSVGGSTGKALFCTWCNAALVFLERWVWLHLFSVFRYLHSLNSLKLKLDCLRVLWGTLLFFPIWNLNPQTLQSPSLQIIVTVVFPILTLCISPWATKGAWELLLSLGSGSVLTNKPLGHVHPVYMSISPLIVLERRKFGVSDIFVSRKCCLFPWEAWAVL